MILISVHNDASRPLVLNNSRRQPPFLVPVPVAVTIGRLPVPANRWELASSAS